MDDRLQNQIDFIVEIDKVKSIFRQTKVIGNTRHENDAEHSWHMAVMAYLLKEYSNRKIDIAKVMAMCLIHDIVEIDAGDTYAFDEQQRATQKQREDAAKKRLFSILPDNQRDELIALFDEFEANQTPEANFARAMDNLQPVLLNHNNHGDNWREHGVTVEQIYKRQTKTQLGSEKLFELTDNIIKENIEKGNFKK